MTRGQGIAAWRKRQGVTQSALAATLGVSPEYISMLEADKRGLSPELAARLSAATDGALTVAELLYPDGLPQGATLAPPMTRDNETTATEAA